MLAQKLILGYGSKVVTQFVQICASIIVARIAGPSVLGTVAFGLAFVSMFGFFADLGIGTAHVKLVSEGREVDNCISTFSILKIILTSFYVAIVIAVFSIQKFIFNIQFESKAHEYVIWISLLSVTISQLLFIPRTTFTAKTEQAKIDIPEFIRIVIHQILRVIIVLLGYKAVALAFGNLISTILIIPFILYLYKDYPRGKFDKKLAYEYLKISIPVLIMGISTKVIFYLDRVALQYFTSSKQVGYYAAGYRIGGLVLLIANSAGLLFFPYFSKAAAKGDLAYIKKTIEKFERFIFIFIMPFIIFLSLYSDVIVKTLLGKQYLPSIPVMAIINLAMFLIVLNMPYGNIITGMGYFNLAAILNLLNMIFFIGMIFVFPNPNFFNLGATGVALSVFLSNLFIGILYRLFSHQKCQIIDLKKGLKFLVFGLVNLIGFYFIYKYCSESYGTYFKVAFIPAYFSITYFGLFIFKMLDKKDFYYIRELLNVKKLESYIRFELKGK